MDFLSLIGGGFSFIGGVVTWLVVTPFHLATDILIYPLAPIAIECCSTDDRKHLEFPFEWMETIDNDLGGDSGWVNEHIEPGSDPYSDWNRTKWLWRNGGHGLTYGLFGVESKEYEIGHDPKLGYTLRDDGAWMYRNFFPITDTKRLEIYWGWGLWANLNERNKYVFTTRIKSVGTY